MDAASLGRRHHRRDLGQRHLQIGYSRAARIVERMWQEGLVTTANHAGKREVLTRPGAGKV